MLSYFHITNTVITQPARRIYGETVVASSRDESSLNVSCRWCEFTSCRFIMACIFSWHLCALGFLLLVPLVVV